MLSISTTLSGVISHAELFLLASCGTLGFRGTPIENHCCSVFDAPINNASKCKWLVAAVVFMANRKLTLIGTKMLWKDTAFFRLRATPLTDCGINKLFPWSLR